LISTIDFSCDMFNPPLRCIQIKITLHSARF